MDLLCMLRGHITGYLKFKMCTTFLSTGQVNNPCP